MVIFCTEEQGRKMFETLTTCYDAYSSWTFHLKFSWNQSSDLEVIVHRTVFDPLSIGSHSYYVKCYSNFASFPSKLLFALFLAFWNFTEIVLVVWLFIVLDICFVIQQSITFNCGKFYCSISLIISYSSLFKNFHFWNFCNLEFFAWSY